MVRLFRGMKEGAGGLAELGESSRGLGVRPGIDVPARAPSDIVRPGDGGLSVSPEDPLNLPYIRRPPEFQGTGRDPVWTITDAELGPDLGYRPDPDSPTHGFVEVARPMTLAEYQLALARVQSSWKKVAAAPAKGE
jgi:hypothetical protein